MSTQYTTLTQVCECGEHVAWEGYGVPEKLICKCGRNLIKPKIVTEKKTVTKKKKEAQRG